MGLVPSGREVSPSPLQQRAEKDSGRATKEKGPYKKPSCRLAGGWRWGCQRPGVRAPRLQTVLSTYYMLSPAKDEMGVGEDRPWRRSCSA